jgi:hypothetical protein
MYESETKNFKKSKMERDWDETESLMPLFSQIFSDKTRPETSGKINQQLSPRLINNQNWSEAETRPGVSVPLVSKPRRDRESRQSVVRRNIDKGTCSNLP